MGVKNYVPFTNSPDIFSVKDAQKLEGDIPRIDGAAAMHRKGEKNPNVYKAVDFMLSPDGQKIVEKSGYIPVQ